MKKQRSSKQKRERPIQKLERMIAENNRLIQMVKREQRKNGKDLRRRMRKLKELIAPKETSSFKSRVIRYK